MALFPTNQLAMGFAKHRPTGEVIVILSHTSGGVEVTTHHMSTTEAHQVAEEIHEIARQVERHESGEEVIDFEALVQDQGAGAGLKQIDEEQEAEQTEAPAPSG